MRVDKLNIDKFKNLQNFSIDIDETQNISVIIGQNGSGKSNLIEALSIIFRDLDLEDITAEFSYTIEYQCGGKKIQIISDKDKKNFFVDDEEVTKTAFYRGRSVYLPRNVFAYYSGTSRRLESHFDKHEEIFYRRLLEDDERALRRMFYAKLIHGQFVLLAFFSLIDELSEETKDDGLLKKYLDVVALESVLFVLKEPAWKKGKGHSKSEFWGARGVVRSFLDMLYPFALAPLKETVTVKQGRSSGKKEITYLFLKDQEQLVTFAKNFSENTQLFKHLESMYLSDLIEDIHIKMKKSDGTVITFNELSEGEKQLLTVIGLIKFTKEQDTLFLLDEPDTHLNPTWKFDYLDLIEKYCGKTDNSQFIISTHDPIVVSGLTKESVLIFERNETGTHVKNPEIDPRGLGIAGVLTSEIFGQMTALDHKTQKDLDKKRQLQYKQDRTPEEEKLYLELEGKLATLGFTRTTQDPLYDKFIERLYLRPEYQTKPLTESDRDELMKITDEILSELLKEEQV
jgi:predicted ATP-dependent endonuclease of OLD family